MIPRLTLGVYSISCYKTLVVLGILVGMVVAWRLAVQWRLSVRHVLILCLTTALVGHYGAHLLDVAVNWHAYQHLTWSEIVVSTKGRAFIGGVLLAAPFAVIYMWCFRLPTWRTLDVLAPALVIAQVFGRLGCFAAGCCHGCPTDGPFGIALSRRKSLPPDWNGVPLHPTQLYEAAGALLIFYGLLWLANKRRLDGAVGIGYLMRYSFLRFSVEFFRGDASRGFLFDGLLSTSQFVSIMLFTIGVLLLAFRSWQSRSTGTPSVHGVMLAHREAPMPTLPTDLGRAA